jgi:hypothetical protein
MTLPADGTDLVFFLALYNWLLSTALTAICILVCNGESKSYP